MVRFGRASYRRGVDGILVISLQFRIENARLSRTAPYGAISRFLSRAAASSRRPARPPSCRGHASSAVLGRLAQLTIHARAFADSRTVGTARAVVEDCVNDFEPDVSTIIRWKFASLDSRLAPLPKGVDVGLASGNGR